MTREKIINFVRECGAYVHQDEYFSFGSIEQLEAFYNAVRNEALEEVAKLWDETREIEDHWDGGKGNPK